MLSHSPPVSTPIEPCRMAPYVSVPSLRLSPAYDRLPFAAVAAAAAAAFPAFDPAILSAAHQVILLFALVFVSIFFRSYNQEG
jgi:short stature homeobox protein